MSAVPGTPWALDVTGEVLTGVEANPVEGFVSFDIFDADDWPGGLEEGRAIAKFIRDRVNAHDELVEALDAVTVLALQNANYHGLTGCDLDFRDEVDKARDLLAKVKP